MKIITGICILLLILGLVSGWWIWSDLTGGAIGLFASGCIAFPLYGLARIFARRARARVDVQEPV